MKNIIGVIIFLGITASANAWTVSVDKHDLVPIVSSCSAQGSVMGKYEISIWDGEDRVNFAFQIPYASTPTLNQQKTTARQYLIDNGYKEDLRKQFQFIKKYRRINGTPSTSPITVDLPE